MTRAREVTETPDAADAFAPAVSKEDEMDDSRKQNSREPKDDSPASLPAGLVRRSLSGRGGLTRAVAAAGLALLLSACGGGGSGAPNSGAALGGPAPSIQADAVVAPAPVARETTPVTRKAAPVAPKTPPDAEETPPPVDLPPVAETIPPPIQESPEPSTSMNIVADPSTIPFPSKSPRIDETVNTNTFGQWGLPVYQPGGDSADKNYGPNVVIRRRVGYGLKELTLPVSGGTGKFAYTHLSFGVIGVNNYWLTYPSDAGDGDLAVHIRVRRGESGSKKTWLISWFEAAAWYGIHVEDFFLTEAYLQAPGSGVQPAAQGSETSATWAGKVIAVDSAAGSILVRGTTIGGDATVTVNFGASPTVDVSLTDLRNARFLSARNKSPSGGLAPARYPNQRWTGLALGNGAFSHTSGRRSIQGAFRSQVASTGTNANTVGGIFDVFGTMKGGFVATIKPPTPF